MADLSTITAVVLAGGLGTRLRSVVNDRPKGLAEICDRPFLAFLLDQLDAAGVRNAVLCTGYLGDLVKDTFGAAHRGLQLSYSQEQLPLGTGGALRLAAPLIHSDPVLALNGDSYAQVDLPAMLDWHRAHHAEATLLLTHVPDTRQYGRVTLNETEAVLEFVEKGRVGGPGWINAGVYLLSRRLILSISDAGAVSLEKDVFPAWAGRGLYGCPRTGRFIDIGTPQTFAAAAEFFSQMRPPKQ
jgi:D-glycero-alpha-D-manno-heptose 1-phosphate guanylyltransferase